MDEAILKKACDVFNLKWFPLLSELCEDMKLTEKVLNDAMDLATRFFKETECYCEGYPSGRYVCITCVYIAGYLNLEGRTQDAIAHSITRILDVHSGKSGGITPVTIRRYMYKIFELFPDVKKEFYDINESACHDDQYKPIVQWRKAKWKT